MRISGWPRPPNQKSLLLLSPVCAQRVSHRAACPLTNHHECSLIVVACVLSGCASQCERSKWLRQRRCVAAEAVEKPWRSRGEAEEKPWRSRGEAVEKRWRSRGEAVEKPWRSRQAVEKPWRSRGEAVEKPWRSRGEAVEKPWSSKATNNITVLLLCYNTVVITLYGFAHCGVKVLRA